MNANGVGRAQFHATFSQHAFQIVARDRPAGLEMVAAIEARDVDADSAGDHRRGMFDLKIVEAEVASLVLCAAPALHLVAFGEMTERIDMRSDMDGHLDPASFSAPISLRRLMPFAAVAPL